MVNFCGLDCGHCKPEYKSMCKGCRSTGGSPFWGQCQIAKCCIEKKHEHCGQCPSFPCDNLKAFSFHPTQGDNGRRIEALRGLRVK